MDDDYAPEMYRFPEIKSLTVKSIPGVEIDLTRVFYDSRNISEVEAMGERNRIIILDNPETVDIHKWIMENAGKVAAAKKLPDDQSATIVAIEEGDAASPYMINYAKENGAIILVGISEDGAITID